MHIMLLNYRLIQYLYICYTYTCREKLMYMFCSIWEFTQSGNLHNVQIVSGKLKIMCCMCTIWRFAMFGLPRVLLFHGQRFFEVDIQHRDCTLAWTMKPSMSDLHCADCLMVCELVSIMRTVRLCKLPHCAWHVNQSSIWMGKQQSTCKSWVA